jgi:hypothetical protein
VQRRCVTVMTGDEFHRALAGHGIQIDGAFQPATSIWRGEREALARLALDTPANGYHVRRVTCRPDSQPAMSSLH